MAGNSARLLAGDGGYTNRQLIMNNQPRSVGESLALAFGFPVPEKIVGLIGRVMERFPRENNAAMNRSLWPDAPGLMFAPYCSTVMHQLQGSPSGSRNGLTQDTGRYRSTPFELFPVLYSGCDGIHWGPVVHAPELQLSDYPWAEHNPAEYEGRGSGSS
ncbi:MAG: hypothetical protein HC771_16685 [Synechococcales cyanobacterium CRU_2_2]|nr:hypothetical protein [Synechococcales cyanobacterium CRU_2_2]